MKNQNFEKPISDLNRLRYQHHFMIMHVIYDYEYLMNTSKNRDLKLEIKP